MMGAWGLIIVISLYGLVRAHLGMRKVMRDFEKDQHR